MIQIHCSNHHASPSKQPTIAVSLGEEDQHLVALTIETEPDEIPIRHRRDQVTRTAIEEARAARFWDPKLLVAEIDRMDSELANPEVVGREMWPDEARALAAMLIHYAQEAERR